MEDYAPAQEVHPMLRPLLVALALAACGPESETCEVTRPSCVPADWTCEVLECFPDGPGAADTTRMLCSGCVRGTVERWYAIADTAGFCGVAWPQTDPAGQFGGPCH